MTLEISFGPLSPALPEFIAGILLFLAVWYGVAKLVVPKFEQTYAERSEQIAGGIERAEQAQAEAKAALEQYRAQLADARGEAAQIREQAKADGAAILAELRAQAKAEAARLVAAAKSQVEAERAQVVRQLRAEVGGLATTLAGRIVGEALDDDERARRTVDRFIADLEAQDAEQRV